MREILAECVEGKLLSRAEALALLAAEGDEFERLLETAAALRDRSKGKIVTFSPKVFIPLTNLCRDFCGYCTFRRAPGETGAKTMTLEEVLAVARRGQRLGCTEALFSLGDKPEAIYPEMADFLKERGYRRTLDYLYDACRTVLEETILLPHSNPGVMGKRDLQRLKAVNGSMGLMLENSSDRLMLAGGPHDQAPDKKPSVRLRMLRQAGELGILFTTGVLIGIGETWEERVDSLLAIRELHQRYHHVQEVIIQNFRAKPAIPMSQQPEPGETEMLKMIALARLILGGDMNIQAPPNLTPDTYDHYLRAGINDWGGVSPLTPDFINPEAPWPALALLQEKSAHAGFQLKARLPVYPEYIRKRSEFIPLSLWPAIERLCATDGFVREKGRRGAQAGSDQSAVPAA